MTNNLYLAKTTNKKTIVEHTEDLINQFNNFLKVYPNILNDNMIKMLYVAICFHDVGKCNRRFQNKLYEKLDIEKIPIEHKEWVEIPHGYLSPSFLDIKKLEKEFSKEEISIIITAIMEHHCRKDMDNDMKLQLKKMIEEELIADISNFNYDRLKYLTKEPHYKYLRYRRYILKGNILEDVVKKYVIIKGLLNKIDYTASSQIENISVEEPVNINGKTISDYIEESLCDKFNLRPIQKYLKDNQDSNLIIVASTGIGKTEGALLWIGKSKGYFTLPLKVSINAIYDRVKNKYNYEKVELIHSSMADIYLSEENATSGQINERIQIARLHTKPLIITTIDQVFKFVFLSKGFEFMLSTLSYSKVVIDEIQMYDPNILACLIRGMKLIQEYGGKFLVMTATFPKYLREVMIEHGINFNYVKEKQFLLESKLVSKRHKIKFIGNDISISHIKSLIRDKKVLLIANTVKAAQDYYIKLSDEGINAKLLHSRFIKKDRNKLENEIYKFGQVDSKGVGIWISTQIVEASLDIDFDILITEMCSIDSFIQRLGRVYRKRYEYKGTDPNVYIIENKNIGRGKVIDPSIYNASLNSLHKYDNCFINEVDKQKMIDDVFDEKNNKDIIKYKDKVRESLNYLNRLGLYDFEAKNIDKRFRNIDSVTCIPANIYTKLVISGKLDNIKEKLNKGDELNKLKIINELKDYTLSIYPNKYIRESDDFLLQKYNIYIIDLIYEFNEDDLTGIGLTSNSELEDVFL